MRDPLIIVSRIINHIRRRGIVHSINSAYAKYVNPETPIKLRGQLYKLQGHPGIGDPLQLLTVSPREINWWIDSSWLSRPFPQNVTIRGGDWDKKAKPFEEFPDYQLFVEHFEEGVPWKETDTYAKRGGYSEEQLAEWDQLYERISNKGYKTQDELGDGNSKGLNGVLNEVHICIGREGELIAKHGLHRISIAKVLNLDSIPVWVRVRHTEWQKIRNSVWKAESIDEIDNCTDDISIHPDLIEY